MGEYEGINREEFALLSQVAYFPHEQLSLIKNKYPELKKLIRSKFSPIVVTSFPKSGSTFISNIFRRILGLSMQILFYDGVETDQSLYIPRIINCLGNKVLAQHHIRGTKSNINIINFFEMPTIVCVRNIFDIMISIVDYNDKLSKQLLSGTLPPHENWFANFPRGFSQYEVDTKFLELSREKKLDILIDTHTSWYLNFYATWKFYVERGDINVYWINYDELISDKLNLFWNGLKYLGLGNDEQERAKQFISNAIEEDELGGNDNRLNKGISGRGLKELNKYQIERIRKIASGYLNIDFREIGL